MATLLTVAVGTRVADADALGRPPAGLRTPPPPPPAPRRRTAATFLTGWNWLAQQLQRGRLWRRLWLTPEPWPAAPPGLALTLAQPP